MGVPLHCCLLVPLPAGGRDVLGGWNGGMDIVLHFRVCRVGGDMVVGEEQSR